MSKIPLSEIQRENLRKIRNDVGITADCLSEDIGKSKGWYSQIENGRLQKISIDDLQLISDKLDCTIRDILGYDPNSIVDISDYNYEWKSAMDIIAENVELKMENKILKEKLELILKIIAR